LGIPVNVFVSLAAALALVALPLALGRSVTGQWAFGVVVPYAAVLVFVFGIALRVARWARAPVPFRIPVTCGQQRSLAWVRSAPIENPHTRLGAVARVALEALLFRSLLRGTRLESHGLGRLSYRPNERLWLAGLIFHYSLLIITLRHFRFFVSPAPAWTQTLAAVDGVFQVGVPVVFASDVALVVAASFLLLRRAWIPTLRIVSTTADYGPLFVVLAIAGTGLVMRHWAPVDLAKVKELVASVLAFRPALPAGGVEPLALAHLFLVAVLVAAIPFGKLSHMVGIFLSPTHALANTSRTRRHVNPWNPQVDVHGYAAWEDEHRAKLKGCGLPVDRDGVGDDG
jgi:nitrate reductase gamma subunit